MKEPSKVMDFRESVRVLDSTLRDGGLVNDFRFSDDFVRALYRANIAAGVDYMEMGYRASKEMFDVSQFGAWKFSDDEKIIEVIGEPDESIKLAIMADVGRCDFKNDIRLKSQSPVSLIRVATYLHQMPEALEMITLHTKLHLPFLASLEAGNLHAYHLHIRLRKYLLLRNPDSTFS